MNGSSASRREVHLGTVVSISIEDLPGASSAVDRAFLWFRDVEVVCSRFDPHSELMRLIQQVGSAVPVSQLLFEAVRFACEMAARTDGAFDPTVGRVMEARGFNREHRSGAEVRTDISPPADVSYRDVVCDADAMTITLRRPAVLDLGAVAKGLALDMNWNLGGGLSVASLTGWRSYSENNLKDNDFSGVDMLRSNASLPKVELLSQELRLSGGSADKRMDWTVGAYASKETIERENDFIWGPQVGNLLPFMVPQYLHIGVWPLIMGVTMFLQMRMNPTPPDPTQAMIFNWMPVIFTFMLASFPAGLVIYWACLLYTSDAAD